MEQSRQGISKTSTGFSRCVNYSSSSVASEGAFSASGFQSGENRYSLAEYKLETSVPLSDWNNCERKSYGRPPLPTKFEKDFNEIMPEYVTKEMLNHLYGSMTF